MFEDVEFALIVSISDDCFYDKWVLDIACTFHMSPKRNWFTTYEMMLLACKIVRPSLASKQV
jgi:hypothetical protein